MQPPPKIVHRTGKFQTRNVLKKQSDTNIPKNPPRNQTKQTKTKS